ncbi:kinase-like domain-containing protein [Staphylotrichum tortipilum]|uniref:cyclin-dependent kinase n=1 Tax=Staphylotrichum tortipilum TaxID=2831512 RepID=A0AAN6MSX3_9PEZI|nr:kinase-like domain-containing protein [Staphylotrichum longicolle]
MADAADWRASLTATERYDNIQKLAGLAAAAGLTKSAFELESEAYNTASSREEYDATCNVPAPAAEPPIPSPTSSPSLAPDSNNQEPSSPGVTIGPYHNCHYIASGVTAAVYRAQTRALKVIVETHNIEPHNPHREAKILSLLRAAHAPNIIALLSTFHDREQRLVLVFPYQPLTLASLLDQTNPNTSPLPLSLLRPIFTALFRALHHLHTAGILHRDIKPSAILLPSPPPFPASSITLADFGTAHHPTLSLPSEPLSQKILDIGTGPYRAPETLFGNRAYGPGVDLWAAGTVLAECLLRKPLFDSRPAHEDGNQLGLVLSIFQTLGTPSEETWPEAVGWRTPPFGMYRVFEGREGGWRGILPQSGVDEGWRGLVEGLVRFESGERVTAGQALEFPCLKGDGDGGGDGEGGEESS